MNKEQIKGILPHREPMLLLDEAHVDEEGNARGVYNVTGEEYFVQGHFPGNPVVPGVIQCEILAQTCCVLMADGMDDVTPYFTGIDKVKFKNKVLPGDAFETVVSITKSRDPFYWATGKGYVNGKLCVQGEFSFALIKNDNEA